MCALCCDDDCGCEGITREPGDPGAPGFLNMSFMAAGVPYTDTSNAWKEVGRFPFSTAVADIFTSIRMNIWRTGGTSVNWQIVDLVSSLQIATGSVTSAFATNIEKIKALQVFNSTNALISLQVQSVGGNTVNISSAMFGYEE